MKKTDSLTSLLPAHCSVQKSVCDISLGVFVCVHVSVPLRTDQSRSRSLRNFQAATLLCLQLEGGRWEWKNAQMYFQNQQSLFSARSCGTRNT